MSLLIKNGAVYMDDSYQKYDILVNDAGIIAQISKYIPDTMANMILNCEDLHIMPGSIDTHTHIRAPGCDARETFESGTKAAAAGGITLIVEQPICNPTPYNEENLNIRIHAANRESFTDFSFYGAAGYEYPDEIDRLASKGIVAYKTFLIAPPQERKNEFTNLYADTDYRLYKTMQHVAKTGKLHMFHAENYNIISGLEEELRSQKMTTGKAHTLSRPPFTEEIAVSRLLHFAKLTNDRIFFAHVSSPESMRLITQAKESGIEAYMETCIHYLTLTEEALELYGPFAKCNPPVRDADSQKQFWEYINNREIDCIGSDHSPFLYEENACHKDDIFLAPAGLVGIDLRQPLMLDAAINGKTSLETMAWIMSQRPAQILGLDQHKGFIRVGADADFTVFSTKEDTLIEKQKSYSKCWKSQVVYDQKRLKGKLKYTIVRGQIVMKDGIVDDHFRGIGKLVY